MGRAYSKWKRGEFFLLDTVNYRPESGQVQIRFRNNDLREAPIDSLWRGRTQGRPDWSKVSVDPDTRSALLVPTLPGHPAIEGEIAEIPSDVIRAATDVDYRAHVANRAARWAKRIGRKLAEARQAQGQTQQAVALAAGLEEGIVAGIESGRSETSLGTINKIFTVLGVSLHDLMEAKES